MNQYSLLYDNCYTSDRTMLHKNAYLDNTKFFTPVYNSVTPPISYFVPRQTTKETFTPETCTSCSGKNWPLTTDEISKNPEIWGPHLWQYLHYSALNYNPKNEDDAKKMKEWLKCLAITIPCQTCSNHYSAYLSKYSDNELYHIC